MVSKNNNVHLHKMIFYFNHHISKSVNYNINTGLLIYYLGMYINITSDNKLISLKEIDNTYRIPTGYNGNL